MASPTRSKRLPLAERAAILPRMQFLYSLTTAEYLRFFPINRDRNNEEFDRFWREHNLFEKARREHVPPTCPKCGSLLSAVTFTCVRGEYCEEVSRG